MQALHSLPSIVEILILSDMSLSVAILSSCVAAAPAGEAARRSSRPRSKRHPRKRGRARNERGRLPYSCGTPAIRSNTRIDDGGQRFAPIVSCCCRHASTSAKVFCSALCARRTDGDLAWRGVWFRSCCSPIFWWRSEAVREVLDGPGAKVEVLVRSTWMLPPRQRGYCLDTRRTAWNVARH